MKAIHRHSGIAFASLAALMSGGCMARLAERRRDMNKRAAQRRLAAVLDGDPSAGVIQDNWLALVPGYAVHDRWPTRPWPTIPDLRVAAARVEQANNYVELAKARSRPAATRGTAASAGGGDDLTGALQGIMLGVSWEADVAGPRVTPAMQPKKNYASRATMRSLRGSPRRDRQS
jgi:hypothetical protein